MTRILIADDHEVVRSGLRKFLESQPKCEVVGEAANGEEALRLAAKLRPQIVLMDMRMPILDGVEDVTAGRTIAVRFRRAGKPMTVAVDPSGPSVTVR
mgnify:CR=1 FL=1